MSRFLLTILRPRSPTTARRIPIKLRTSLDRTILLPRLLRNIHRRPKVALTKLQAIVITALITEAMSDIGPTASSIGLGSTGNDLVIR